MQSVRQSLLTICVCLYAFLAVTLGLIFLVGRADNSVASGFYHPELPFSLEVLDDSLSKTGSLEETPNLQPLSDGEETLLSQR